jgi:hypothetical protein
LGKEYLKHLSPHGDIVEETAKYLNYI